jgi:hypothetical protein
MYVVRNSSRALFTALIPLAVVHAVLLAMALLATQTVPPEAVAPAPDTVLLSFAAQLAFDGILLFAGHIALRQFAISNRVAYALTGGVMAATSYLLATRNGVTLFAPPSGSEFTAGLLPVAAGMLAGFLYGQFAGLEAVAQRQSRQARGRAHRASSTVRFASAPRLAPSSSHP